MDTSRYRAAWYSAKAAELHGSVFWRAPDGREVELTAVTEGDYFWEDKVSVGPVVEYVRKGMFGTQEHSNDSRIGGVFGMRNGRERR
jgi:hypothetical protein